MQKYVQPSVVFVAFAVTALSGFAANDIIQANAYDDAWESGWVTRGRQILNAGGGKTAGFVLQIGDSITHSSPNGQWPRYGSGKTGDDTALCNWLKAPNWGSGNSDTASKNGFYLAAADTSGGRGMTAASGITTAEYLSGNNNGGGAMPSDTNSASARTKVADPSAYGNNLHIDTVLGAFSDAQFAVVMLGTNDANGSRTVSAFSTDLNAIVLKIEALNIVPVLSTIPPTTNSNGAGLIDSYNSAIRSLAQTRNLPLIDYHAEIQARRAGTDWQNTLISSDGIHPSASAGAASSSSDPYADGGDAGAHRTGANCENVGYLLRSWLTIQKLKEVKSYIVDGNNPPSPPPPPPPPATVDRIDVSPASVAVAVNASQTFSAVARDVNGAALVPQPTLTWSVSGGGTISATGLFTAVSAAGGPFTVTASAGVKSGTAAVSVFKPNAAPVMVSAPSAAPNPAKIGETITFTTLAADGDAEPLVYAWNFGGQGGASINPATFAFGAPGEYLVSVSATDPRGASVSASLVAIVLAPSRFEIDDDGDGFSNGDEDVAGTNAQSSLSYPGGPGDSDGDGTPDSGDSDDDNDGVSDGVELSQGTDPWNPNSFKRLTLVVARLSGKAQGLGKDQLSLSGKITGLPPGYSPDGTAVELKIGNAPVVFTLDGKARAKNASGSMQISLKPVQKDKATKQVTFLGGDVLFKAKVSNGAWAEAWGVDLAGPGGPLVLPVNLRLGGLLYGADVPVQTKMTKGKATLKL